MPTPYFLILQSFLTDRFFRVSEGISQSQVFPIKAGVPQGSVLAPLLYSIYTSDIPTYNTTIIATFADDTAILSSHSDYETVSANLQNHLTQLQTWFTNWRIKINAQKTHQLTITLRRQTCPPVYLYGQALNQTDKVRYLGLYIDRRLTWNTHVNSKRKTLEARRKQLFTLLSRRSRLPLSQKVRVYKTLLQPIWTYACQIYGTAKPSVAARIQRFQSKVLRIITNSPYYVSNETLHTDLRIPYVNDIFLKLYRRFKKKLALNTNELIRELGSPYLPGNTRRRLRRRWSRDMAND